MNTAYSTTGVSFLTNIAFDMVSAPFYDLATTGLISTTYNAGGTLLTSFSAGDFLGNVQQFDCSIAANSVVIPANIVAAPVIADFSMAQGVITSIEKETDPGVLNYRIQDFQVDIQDYLTATSSGSTAGLMYDMMRASDYVRGSTGSDRLFGFNGNDTLYGGTGVTDTADGGDTLFGGLGQDTIYGNGGDDIILGDAVLNGTSGGADVIYGGLGNDSAYGGAGADVIYGHAGNDLLCGGKGYDTLSGGDGNDIFLILNSGGEDLILDYDDSGTDIISLQRTATIQNFSDVQAHLVSDANGSYIALGGGDGLLLAGVLAGELTAADFYFWG